MPERVSPAELKVEPKPDNTVLLTIPARAEYITLARLALAGLGNQGRLQEETVADLKVAVSEACALLLRFISADEPAAKIRIAFRMFDGRWAVEVSGDPGRLPPLQELEDPSTETGLGLTIIRALVDQLDVGAEEEGRDRLRLVKHV
jgi:serine/threonine-protein kinase RsbW